jgi:hypothetical protein
VGSGTAKKQRPANASDQLLRQRGRTVFERQSSLLRTESNYKGTLPLDAVEVITMFHDTLRAFCLGQFGVSERCNTKKF